jgi:hypothetical protein
MKKCTTCNTEKELSEFGKCRQNPDGYKYACKACTNAKHREWLENNPHQRRKYVNRKKKRYANNPELYRDSRLKNMYGITLEDYNSKLEEQEGKCAICKCTQEKNFHVDHNHETGQVRGLLCSHCNHMIGKAKEDVQILKEGVRYLRRHEYLAL